MVTGLQIMHAGRAIELLYKIGDQVDGTQIWKARPLFVDDDGPVDVSIRPEDRCSRIHTNAGRPWRPKAA
jgi:hypothetical protein